jgi:hypothetical protein
VNRLTFLSHFLLSLAVGAGAFLAWRAGALAAVWESDKSMMTSAIGALLIGTLAWLGRQAWRADDPERHYFKYNIDASFGHLSERLAVILGFVGTAIGLSLQAKALAGGSASFDALATSLFTTASGGTAAGIIAVATYNLEVGLRRVR